MPLDPTKQERTVAVHGGAHTYHLVYASDGIPAVEVFVAPYREDGQPTFTMNRPDVATAMGALVDEVACLREAVAVHVAAVRAELALLPASSCHVGVLAGRTNILAAVAGVD